MKKINMEDIELLILKIIFIPAIICGVFGLGYCILETIKAIIWLFTKY